MDQDSIDKLLNRDDVYGSNDWVSALHLEEYFEDDNPNLWKALLASWAADTTNTLWFYKDGTLEELDKIVNESGGRFNAPEVALELGNLCIKKTPLVKWLKKRRDPVTTITIDTAHPACNPWMRRTLVALQAIIDEELTGEVPGRLPSKKHIHDWLEKRYPSPQSTSNFLDAASTILNPSRKRQ